MIRSTVRDQVYFSVVVSGYVFLCGSDIYQRMHY